jgi:hypothetical protein
LANFSASSRFMNIDFRWGPKRPEIEAYLTRNRDPTRIFKEERSGYAGLGEGGLPMDESVSIQRRVERMIRECWALGVEPDSIAIAEIMVDDEVTAGKYQEFSPAWRVARAKYEEAAARQLGHPASSLPWGERKRA